MAYLTPFSIMAFWKLLVHLLLMTFCKQNATLVQHLSEIHFLTLLHSHLNLLDPIPHQYKFPKKQKFHLQPLW